MDKKLQVDIEYKEKEKISSLTTYKTEGWVLGAYYPKNEKQLKAIIKHFKDNNIRYKIIGNGSNLLISPNAEIFIVSTKKMQQKINLTNDILEVPSSMPLYKIYEFCLAKNKSGFEHFALIPGSLGGAIKMNASCFGHAIFDDLIEVKVYKNGRVFAIKKDKIEFGYRHTNLDNFTIISAKFKVFDEKSYKIKQNYLNYLVRRTLNQPKGLSCGSVFKNPAHRAAGKLIDDCGLKGMTRNGAQISPMHSNFIINNGRAKYEDILYLIELCISSVQDKFKITLEPEVEIIK